MFILFNKQKMLVDVWSEHVSCIIKTFFPYDGQILMALSKCWPQRIP